LILHKLALAAGFQMHVPKPIEPIQLLTVVARLAGRCNWRQRAEGRWQKEENLFLPSAIGFKAP